MSDQGNVQDHSDNGPQGSAKRESLTDKVQAELAEKIGSGTYAPGEKLPREKDLVAAFSVSRTVIREALALLRAEGLIEIRHGVGAFVCEPSVQGFKFPAIASGLRKRSDLLELLELRKGIEIEAAGLAAQRRSPAQNERILEAFREFCLALAVGHAQASDKDFELHRSIAAATNNRYYLEFLDFLASQTAQESTRLLYGGEQSRQLDQLKALEEEHRLLVEAINHQEVEGAREAMRSHLKASEDRFLALTIS